MCLRIPGVFRFSGLAVSSCVLVVIFVSVSPSSVSVLGEDFLSVSDCEFVESQSFSLCRKRQAFLIQSQGGMSMEDTAEEVPPMSRRKIQEVDCGVDHRWAAIYQAVGKRMLDHLNKCEGLKVDTQELEYHVLAPNEPHMVMHARGERHQQLFYPLSQHGAKDILVASVARWDEHERMLIILEQKSQELCQAIEQTSEMQELLAA